MTLPDRAISLLATARIANTPSVVCNVWVGIAIAVLFSGPISPDSLWLQTLLISLSGVFLYVAGNLFNDLYDLPWDRKHRPERALPRGVFKPIHYLCLGAAFSITGIAIAFQAHFLSGLTALAILFFIAIYTLWHKRTPWAVIPMGVCRALLPVMGFFALVGSRLHPPDLPLQDSFFVLPSALLLLHPIALLLYIIGLSLSARAESTSLSPAASLLSKIPLFLSGLLAAAAWSPVVSWKLLAGLLPFLLWLTFCLTKYRRPIPAHVSALLAGIPLLDTIGMLPLAISVSGLGPFSVACLLIPALAFISGRALQKLAPAT